VRARAVSPVTEMLRRSMQKASAPLAPDRRRVSRQLLTDMNIAQLQVTTISDNYYSHTYIPFHILTTIQKREIIINPLSDADVYIRQIL
jgi:hypothetical protein